MIAQLPLDYNTWVIPVLSNFSRIELSQEEIDLIDHTAHQIANAKRKEKGYLRDTDSLIKRYTTGLGGEMALGKFLGVSIVDTSVGASEDYNIGDLNKIGLDIGVKTVEYPKFPLVHTRPERCEIILIKHRNQHVYKICGLYTPETMILHSSRELVVDEKVRESKTAFYGIPFCKTFKTTEDLKTYCRVMKLADIPSGYGGVEDLIKTGLVTIS
jgi:hypothetical protein